MKTNEDIIDGLYEQSLINYEKLQKPRQNIHVSDLTSDCYRKAWYRLNKFDTLPKTFKQVVPLVHGTMLHECCNLGGIEHEIQLAGNLFTLEKAKYTNVKRKGKDAWQILQGSMDDLIEIDDELFICDKKTVKQSLPRTVSEQYQKQLNIYKLLYYINYGKDIKHGAIIYIDKSSGWIRHKTRIVELLDIDEIQSYCQDVLKQIQQKNEPQRVESFLCNWCPYRKECLGYE